MLRVLQFITSVFETMLKNDEKIHEHEMTICLPHLIDKSGHKSERHKAAFITCLRAAGEIIAPNKLCQFLLQGIYCILHVTYIHTYIHTSKSTSHH